MIGPRPDPKPLNIVIVGGSLTGLFAGIVLKSLPQVSTITILERLREEQLQDLGAGIRCNQEVNDAILERLGVEPDEYAAFLNVYRSFDSKGRELSKLDIETWTTTWGQLFRVLRRGFEGHIGEWKEKTAKCEYRLGCSFVGLQELKEDEVNGTQNSSDSQTASRPCIRVDFTNEHGQTESITADLVIGADGASSKVRSLASPEVKRTTTSYLCYRGVVNPSDLSPSTVSLYHRTTIFSWPGRNTGQFVSYVVPGTSDKPSESTHCVNWVLYSNKSPEEIKQLMTDRDGKVHQYTLPRGKMSDKEVEKLRQEARETLPDVHVEVIEKTEHPFVQLVTDSLATRNSFMDGRLLLVGDAVGGQRPHAASALMQGIYHGLLLRKLLQNEVTLDQWSEQTRELTQVLVETGQEMGEILMHTVAPPQEKIPLYLRNFMTTQMKLNKIWQGTIGIGNATVKM